ncbi:hypothetical protein HNQ75_003259 [Rhizobium flavum]|uniref:Uncharacterized protein n=1 Tax=Pseudorhizobium flavum TaxID=1335061 RepID=A0A7W9Z0D7_9HYPH|nr:hypothetical protein [Pseudorhizobium flavum]MBB6181274.1 hypothetical protein [Pseudorhizobium flavum]CAD6601509.1 hypothetical protein RFYW14_00890 [Pseudorhizobium flavum]
MSNEQLHVKLLAGNRRGSKQPMAMPLKRAERHENEGLARIHSEGKLFGFIVASQGSNRIEAILAPEPREIERRCRLRYGSRFGHASLEILNGILQAHSACPPPDHSPLLGQQEPRNPLTSLVAPPTFQARVVWPRQKRKRDAVIRLHGQGAGNGQQRKIKMPREKPRRRLHLVAQDRVHTQRPQIPGRMLAKSIGEHRAIVNGAENA